MAFSSSLAFPSSASATNGFASCIGIPFSSSNTLSLSLLALKSPAAMSMGILRRNQNRTLCKAATASDALSATPETVKKVVEIVANQLATPADTIDPQSRFQELGADSLDQVEIVMALEEEFNINVSENGADSISTVQDAADLIQRAVSEKDGQ